jgi:RNA chaperone Hfq
MLDTYMTDRTPVTITLQNKIRVSGRIRMFDSHVIIMEGHKQEILYRHAVSCLSPLVKEMQKRPPATSRPVPAKITTPRPARTVPHKSGNAQQPQELSPSVVDGLNNSMKDGLLKWMQEQKAAK